jgi:uncharacterized membrane protein
MNKHTATIILASITILIVAAALTPLIPVTQLKYSELGILGPDGTAKSYPTSVAVNQSFLLYGFVGNHEGNVESYQLLVKLGNQTTVVDNATYANAPVLATYWHIVGENQTWTFPMSLTVNQAGNNTRIIFELWSYNVPASNFEYAGLWDYIWLNVTA